MIRVHLDSDDDRTVVGIELTLDEATRFCREGKDAYHGMDELHFDNVPITIEEPK